MKYTISESTKTVTVETTENGETLGQVENVVRTLAKPASWDEVRREAVRLTGPAETEIDHAFDPLEGITYPETPSYLMAAE